MLFLVAEKSKCCFVCSVYMLLIVWWSKLKQVLFPVLIFTYLGCNYWPPRFRPNFIQATKYVGLSRYRLLAFSDDVTSVLGMTHCFSLWVESSLGQSEVCRSRASPVRLPTSMSVQGSSRWLGAAFPARTRTRLVLGFVLLNCLLVSNVLKTVYIVMGLYLW
jgi:hypothetical protein